MIRGTKNEGISSLSKQRHEALLVNGEGIVGQSVETIINSSGVLLEVTDEFSNHSAGRSTFPSGEFNGTYE